MNTKTIPSVIIISPTILYSDKYLIEFIKFYYPNIDNKTHYDTYILPNLPKVSTTSGLWTYEEVYSILNEVSDPSRELRRNLHIIGGYALFSK